MDTETLHACCMCGGTDLRTIDPTAELTECTRCAYVFANPRPTPQELAVYYSKPSKYDDWLSAEKERAQLWERRLRILNRNKKSGTLLDVGTGIGQLLHQAASRYTAVFGTEISEAAINIAQKKYGLRIFRGQLEDLPLNQKFDNITLFHILEHVHNPRTFLERCHALLETGGTLTLAVPNDLRSWELKIRTWLKKKSRTLPPGVGPLGLPKIVLNGTVDEIHLSQFTPQSLAAILEKLQFKVVVNTIDPYYAKKGFMLALHQLHFRFHWVLNKMFGINRYNTILMVAQKI